MILIKEFGLESIYAFKNISFNEDLKKHLHTKMGGKADYYIEPFTYLELQDIINIFKHDKIPIIVIGSGANLIVRDGGVRGLVISLKNFNNIKVNGDEILAGSGTSLIKTTYIALQHNLTGFEFASGIPGTIGGAVFMNAGAYGGEIKDVLESVIVLDKNLNIIQRKAEDLNIGYRYTNIEENGDIILEAKFKLSKGKHDEIKAKMDELSISRQSKQPLDYPSCGSVFKRPPGMFAGKLIQDCGLQGFRIGGAEVSRKHANFILNVDNATSTDYLAVMNHVQNTVLEKFGVWLEPEVKIIGED